MPAIYKRTQRWKPTHRFAIARAQFQRIVREIAETHQEKLIFQPEALMALQADAEEYLAERFVRAGLMAERFCSKTVTDKHFKDLDIPTPQHAGLVPEATADTPPEPQGVDVPPAVEVAAVAIAVAE